MKKEEDLEVREEVTEIFDGLASGVSPLEKVRGSHNHGPDNMMKPIKLKLGMKRGKTAVGGEWGIRVSHCKGRT